MELYVILANGEFILSLGNIPITFMSEDKAKQYCANFSDEARTITYVKMLPEKGGR